MKAALPIILAALSLLFPLSTLAAGPTVSMSPTLLEAPVGQVVPLVVQVNAVEGLYGFELQLGFDPTVIEIVDANPNAAGIQLLPGDFLSYDMPVRNSADNTTGTIEYVLTQVNPSEAKNGTGALFTILVKGKAAGKSALQIRQAQFANRNGEPIAVEWTNGQVQVTANATPVASNPTPLPPAPTPQIDLTRVIEEQSQTPITPAAPGVTVTPAATLTGTAPTVVLTAPSSTSLPATVATPTGEAAQAIAAATLGAATAAAVAAPAAPSATTTPAENGEPAPATAQVISAAATSESAAVATALPLTVVSAPTRVPAAVEERGNKTLLFAGGALLLLAAAGAASLIIISRGK